MFFFFISFLVMGALPLDRWTNRFSVFSQFEKEKQHDIRSFFSPSANKDKKRRRGEDGGETSSISSEVNSENEDRNSSPSDLDFSPQLKRLRTPRPRPSPLSRFGGKQAALRSPGVSVMTPRKLAQPEVVSTWNCGACTYSNSCLLPYCEMCEFPRSASTLKTGNGSSSSVIFFFVLILHLIFHFDSHYSKLKSEIPHYIVQDYQVPWI